MAAASRRDASRSSASTMFNPSRPAPTASARAKLRSSNRAPTPLRARPAARPRPPDASASGSWSSRRRPRAWRAAAPGRSRRASTARRPRAGAASGNRRDDVARAAASPRGSAAPADAATVSTAAARPCARRMLLSSPTSVPTLRSSIEAEARQRGDVPDVRPRVTATSRTPRSRFGVRDDERFRPIASSSKSTVTFVSRPAPESSAIVPAPELASASRARRLHERGASCDSSSTSMRTPAGAAGAATPPTREASSATVARAAARAASLTLAGRSPRHARPCCDSMVALFQHRSGIASRKLDGTRGQQLAIAPAAARAGEVQPSLGPGDADVEQPALLLQHAPDRRSARASGKRPSSSPADEHHRKLQALGVVQRHQRDRIRVRRPACRRSATSVARWRKWSSGVQPDFAALVGDRLRRRRRSAPARCRGARRRPAPSRAQVVGIADRVDEVAQQLVDGSVAARCSRSRADQCRRTRPAPSRAARAQPAERHPAGARRSNSGTPAARAPLGRASRPWCRRCRAWARRRRGGRLRRRRDSR